MKFSTVISSLFLAQGALAFTPASQVPTVSQLTAATSTAEVTKTMESVKYDTSVNTEQKFKVKDVDAAILDPKKRVQTGRYNSKENSIAVPFLKRPTNLDGTHAGDVGFDPLGLTESLDMYTMMESEIRHARLAMLAVIGWPLSELMGPNFMLHGPNHIAPSVLNGFDPLSFITVAAIFGGFGYFEYKTSLRRVDDTPIGKKHAEDMANVWKYGVPGDYNFDPLNLYSSFGDSADGRKAMRELEIAHGRAAMGGITSFAIWEALTGHPIVENSMFFHPNAVLPALGLGYLAFGFFYEVKSTPQYLLQIEQTSEGAVRMEGIQRKINEYAEDTKVVRGQAFEIASEYAVKTFEAARDLKENYDNVTDDYTKSVMSKNYDIEK